MAEVKKIPPLKCPQCGSEKCSTNKARSVVCLGCGYKTTKGGNKIKVHELITPYWHPTGPVKEPSRDDLDSYEPPFRPRRR